MFPIMDLTVFSPDAQAKMMELFAKYLIEKNAVQNTADDKVEDSCFAAVTPSKAQQIDTQQEVIPDQHDFLSAGDSGAEAGKILSDSDRCKLEHQLSIYNRMVVDNKRLNKYFEKVQLPHVVDRLEDVIRTKTKVDANAPFLNELIR